MTEGGGSGASLRDDVTGGGVLLGVAPVFVVTGCAGGPSTRIPVLDCVEGGGTGDSVMFATCAGRGIGELVDASLRGCSTDVCDCAVDVVELFELPSRFEVAAE